MALAFCVGYSISNIGFAKAISPVAHGIPRIMAIRYPVCSVSLNIKTSFFCFAAQRGVEVKLILPHIPDKKYAYLLARTYYQQLISNGVEIYEYTPGFVHAKVFTCDDERAVVGTINLDYRSLYLHFECAAYIWKNPVINDIELDFFHTLEKCQRIDLENCKKYNPIAKVAGQILRLIAPLM